MKKTKLTGIADTSSYGFNLGSEIEISKGSAKKIKAMFRGSPYVKLVNGDPKVGNSTWKLRESEDGNDQLCQYEFVTQGSRTFLNAHGNPTKIATGFNDIPVIVKGFEGVDGNGRNSAYNTFRFLNRVVFILLEHIPSSSPFVWEGEDRRTFEKGDINIKQSQYAWYSNDLGSVENRNTVLNYLRACYSGNSIFDGKVKNIANFLKLVTHNWNNSDNITIEAKSSKDPLFSLTFYAKDVEGTYDKKNLKRVQGLIRFDCTFRPKFLELNKIRKVYDLEKRYVEECEKNGYDIGFYKWLSDKVINRLKLQYVCSLTAFTFDQMLSKCGEVTGKTQRKLLDHWLEDGTEYASIGDKCEALEINPKHYADAAKAIMDKTGIDIEVPKDYHISMLFNRTAGRMSADEMQAWLRKNSNRVISFEELKKRDFEAVKNIEATFVNNQVVRMRKLKPVVVHRDNLHAYRLLKGEVNELR